MNKTVTLSNSTQEHEPVSSSTKQYELLWTVCMIAVVAIVEHSVILLLTGIDKTLRQKPFVVSILLLSTSDVLLSLALLLYLLVNLASLRQTWICGLTNFLLQLGWVSSSVHTLIICSERYLATRPIQMKFFTVRKRQILTVISMGICSVILGIPYLFTVKEATIVSCTRINLFLDNWPYVLFPGRSLSILIWMCTVIIYILTVHNLVRALQRSDWLRGRHFKHNVRLSAEGAILQHDSNSSRSHFSKSLTNIGENGVVSTQTNRPKRTSEDNVGDNDATSYTPDKITVHTDRVPDEAHHPRPGTRVQTDETCVGHIQDTMLGNKLNENTIEINKPNVISVIAQPSLFTKESCSRAVNLWKEIKSRSVPPTHEVKAFRIVSVIFLVFLVTMTPQCVSGLVMMFVPLSSVVDWLCEVLAVSSILIHPFMYAFLLKDFRNKLRCK